MELLIAGVIGIALLVTIGLIAAKAPAVVRVVVSIAAVVIVAVFCFGQGVAYKSVLFYSSYVYWIREYSAHLAKLAQADDCERLKQTVQRFDERMKGEPENAATLEDTMHELLNAGRYYEPEDSVTTRPKGEDKVGGP